MNGSPYLACLSNGAANPRSPTFVIHVYDSIYDRANTYGLHKKHILSHRIFTTVYLFNPVSNI